MGLIDTTLKNTKRAIALVLIVAIIFVILGPIITIWALNTVGFSLELNVFTWTSIFWFHCIIASIGTLRKN
jgi:hypothetical protein